MITHAFSPQFHQEPLRQQNYAISPFATPTNAISDAVRQLPQVDAGSEYHKSLVYTTASSINTLRQNPSHFVNMPSKRNGSDEQNNNGNGNPPKHIKTEHPEEFSNAVKKKLQSSSRTGQACDRCKVSQ
jgi:hypothetical protein